MDKSGSSPPCNRVRAICSAEQGLSESNGSLLHPLFFPVIPLAAVLWDFLQSAPGRFLVVDVAPLVKNRPTSTFDNADDTPLLPRSPFSLLLRQRLSSFPSSLSSFSGFSLVWFTFLVPVYSVFVIRLSFCSVTYTVYFTRLLPIRPTSAFGVSDREKNTRLYLVLPFCLYYSILPVQLSSSSAGRSLQLHLH